MATSTLIPFDSVAIGLDSPVHSTAAAGYSARNHGIQVISLSFSEGHLSPVVTILGKIDNYAPQITAAARYRESSLGIGPQMSN